jgi:protein-L-isoaspartate(D-aspartate) O-methyltransferase
MTASPGPIVQDRADELRTAMVNSLREEGVIVSDAVAAAFSAVPRHLFAPGETMEAAYAPHGTVVPRRDEDGLLLQGSSRACACSRSGQAAITRR